MADPLEQEAHRLILLGRYLDWGEIQVVRGYLDSNGVDCLVADGHSGTFDGSLMIGGFRLMVPADQAMRARLLLKEVSAQTAPAALERCPRCQNTHVTGVRRPRWGLIGALLGFDRPDSYGMRHCQDCGHRWQRP